MKLGRTTAVEVVPATERAMERRRGSSSTARPRPAAGASRGADGTRSPGKRTSRAPRRYGGSWHLRRVPLGFLAYVDGEVVVGAASPFDPSRRVWRTRAPSPPSRSARVGHRLLPCSGRLSTARVCAALLDGVVGGGARGWRAGCRGISDRSGGRRVDVGFAYVGLVPMFERAGFDAGRHDLRAQRPGTRA